MCSSVSPAARSGVAGDNQGRDLHDLAFAAGGRAGVPERVGDVALSLGPVAVGRGDDSEQCVLDRVVRHDHKMRRWADSTLTSD